MRRTRAGSIRAMDAPRTQAYRHGLAGTWRVRVLAPKEAMKPLMMLLSAVALAVVAAAPASAGPNPSPVAPAHTGTACVNVISHNPQAGEDSHSAPAAQENFTEVGTAFCGV